MKNTILTFKKKKAAGQKITVLTAYDYTMAKIIDRAGVNAILVGDSLGNVMLGYDNTLSVTMEDMIHHCKAVSRAVKESMVIVDMPFMSYQVSVEQAVVNAGRLVKEGGAHAVKLEGGRKVCAQIESIVAAGIPVMAHIGLTPQSVNAIGGFLVQGKTEEAARELIEDAMAVEKAGAFALTLECVPKKLSQLITERIEIPTIGIGCGVGCDGQVLVAHDMMGMDADFSPKFVKTFAQVGDIMTEAVKHYVRAVEQCEFPADEHSFSIDEEIIDKLY